MRACNQLELASSHPELLVDWTGTGAHQSFYDYVCARAKSTSPEHEYESARNKDLRLFLSEMKRMGTPAQHARAAELHDHLANKLDGVQPSFTRFLKRLHEKRRTWGKDFGVVVLFRTMGHDLKEVMPELVDVARNTSGMDVEEGVFFHQGEREVFKFAGVEQPRASFSSWLHAIGAAGGDRFLAIKDDHKYWRARGKATTAGKPFPIYADALSIFFDDNIDATETSIVHAFEPASADVVAAVSSAELSRSLVGRNLVVVDPLRVVLDEDYFINEYNRVCDVLEMPTWLKL